MVLSRREFVMAAKVMGATNFRVVTREILPNLVIPIMAYGFLIVAALMIADGSLSFLGLGIPPPTPDWGGMVRAGYDFLAVNPLLSLGPGTAVGLTVLGFYLVGSSVE